MCRPVPLLALGAVILVGSLIALGPGGRTLAQEATPIVEAGDPEALSGLSAQLLAVGFADELPSPARLEFLSIEFAPDGGFALDPEDPATALVFVAAGTLSFRVEAPMTVLRASPTGEPSPADLEEIAPGEIFTMSTGDSAMFEPRTAGETLNLGAEPAVLLVVNIYPLDEEPMATPVA